MCFTIGSQCSFRNALAEHSVSCSHTPSQADESGGRFSPLGTPDMKTVFCHHHHVYHSEHLLTCQGLKSTDLVASSQPENCPTTAAPVKGRIVATQRRRGNHGHSAATPHHHHQHACITDSRGVSFHITVSSNRFRYLAYGEDHNLEASTWRPPPLTLPM